MLDRAQSESKQHKHQHPHGDQGLHGLVSHLHGGSGHDHHHHKDLLSAEHRIEHILKKHPHDFAHVFHELDELRKHDRKHFSADLHAINSDLHKRGYLPHLQIVEDNSTHHHKVEHGYEVLADDPQLRGMPGKHTIVSTSHRAPKESSRLRHIYHSMNHGHGHNLWNRSVEGGGGADGGYDGKAIGGHIPTGARKELIDKALQLAGLPATADYEAAVNKIVTRESGWNPNITNHTDSNARRGTPSTGLMQTIPSTFHAFALKGLDTNIHDPLSNLVAGIRYAESKYHNRGGIRFVASRPGGY